MPGVTASLAFSLAARLTGAAVGGDTPQYTANVSRSLSFDPGTDATNKADRLYKATRNLAASANENLDLSGVLVDALGAVVTQAEILAIVIEADPTNVNDVKFGPAAANGALGPFNAAADRLTLAPGDFHVLTCKRGWTITAGTGDQINVANAGAGTGVNYTITLIGRSVAA